jgi:hypothetical protein
MNTRVRTFLLAGAIAMAPIAAWANVFDNVASKIHDRMSEAEVRRIVGRAPARVEAAPGLCDAAQFSNVKFES